MRRTTVVNRVFVLSTMTAVVAATLSASGYAAGAAAQDDASPSVWDGVYSTEQAREGQALYRETCARCHGEDLTGSNASALVGDAFILDWGGLKLNSVLTRVRTMPPGRAGILDDDSYLAVTAYLLKANAFPAGSDALTAAHAAEVDVYGADGPDAVPNFALVQVVGCLDRDMDDRTWIVTDASEPIRTRDPEASEDDLLMITRTIPLGDNTLELMYVFPDPAAYKGHRVEAKGFLIRRGHMGAPDAINVTMVGSLDAACRP